MFLAIVSFLFARSDHLSVYHETGGGIVAAELYAENDALLSYHRSRIIFHVTRLYNVIP